MHSLTHSWNTHQSTTVSFFCMLLLITSWRKFRIFEKVHVHMTHCYIPKCSKYESTCNSENVFNHALVIANHVCVDFASPGSACGTFFRSFKCGTSVLLWASSKTQGRKYSENSRHLSSWLAALAGIGLFSGEGTKGKQMCREELFWLPKSTGFVHVHHFFISQNANKY